MLYGSVERSKGSVTFEVYDLASLILDVDVYSFDFLVVDHY